MGAAGARVLAWLRGEEATDILVARCAAGDYAGVETLLESNVPANGKSRSGITALYAAVENRQRDIVWLLLQRGADVGVAMSHDGDTALARAAAIGDADICQKLLVFGANPAQPGADAMTPLVLATRGNYVAVMRALLARGADPSLPIGARTTKRSFVGMTPLLIAVSEGRVEAVRVLVSAGARDDRAVAAARAASNDNDNQTMEPAHMLRLMLPAV